MKRLGPRWTQNLGLHIFDLCKATSFPNHEAAFSSLDWISPSCLATVKPKGDSEVLLRFLCGGSALAYSMEMECVLCWTIPTPQTVAATMMSLEPAIRVVEKSRNARKKEIHVAKYPFPTALNGCQKVSVTAAAIHQRNKKTYKKLVILAALATFAQDTM
mmetsp:Transcript_67064/g.112514  ORF Transcript_67064/g.112514 Transcript_67064/m.112514 type:complete len:160 (-) Transcript_67064:183-662(-)